MILLWLYIVFHLSCCVVHCQHLEWDGTEFSNNSVIYSGDISNGSTALKCLTDNNNCCSPNTGNWINQTGQIANQEPDRDRCLYFTRGDRVMSLNRLRGCIPPLAGLWRCDVPDSSGVIQSLFIYIATSDTSGQLSDSMTIHFTLHTEPRVGPPQFTISCQTYGGPATEVSWVWNRRKRLTKIVTESKYVILMEGSRNHSVYIETSQTILDTSDLSVYDNKLLVRGRLGGEFTCDIRNTFYSLLRTNTTTITVAGEPSKLTGVISSSNNTHVNITVSWESPADTVTTGYVIYYQPKTGGPVISESVTGGHRESHSLTGLQRGHTYNIFIVALSQHLPSPLAGPVHVATGPLLVVETSPQSLNVTSNEPFSLNCTVRAEHEGNPVNTVIKWIRISDNAPGMKTVLEGPSVFDNSSEPEYGSGLSSSTLDQFLTPAVLEYQLVESVTESSTFIYRCEATVLNTTSFSDSTVFVKKMKVAVSTTQIISTSQFISSSITQTISAHTVTSISSMTTTKGSSTSPFTTSSISSSSVSSSSFIEVITTTVSGKISSKRVSSSRVASNTPEVEIMNTSTSGTAPEETWVLVTSAVTGAVITAILISFLVFIVLFKRTDRRKKDQQPLSQTLQPLEMKPVDMRYGVYDRMSTGRGFEVEEDISDVPVVRSDIPVSDFPHYVLDMADETRHTESKLAIEYLQLQNNYTSTYDVAYLPQNIDLNRFRNIYPYDDSRVPLTEIPGEPGSDYINASSISGYHGSRYIAAQAPLIETIDNFWRMIWEYGVETIVMLTRCVELSREKCAQYWPESLNDDITPGDRISVTLLASTPYAEYHIRKFLVKHLVENTKPMTVTQFHYTSWPDHGVPDNVMAIIRFIRHVRKLFPASQDPPLLVHCSAGVGRTGTFITLDMMMQQMRTEGTLSVCQCVKHIRTQRMKMVQTLAQYEFIHYALSELVMCGETEIVAANLRSFTDTLNVPGEDSGPSIAQQHMTTLDNLCAQQKCDFTGAKNKGNVNKNRIQDKLPNEIYRVTLRSIAGFESDYINASFINGYKQKNAYIATQGPLKETVEDFWRMMWEYRCGCIVMLCQLEEDGQESSYCYWPGEEGEQMVSGRLKVRLVRVRGHGDILERKLEVTGSDSFSTDILTVKMIQLTSWPLQELPHPAGIMSLIEKLNYVLMRSSSKQTVVMCSDGVVRSGTFLCIHSQLERLKTEGTVDVFQAIRSARIQRPGVVPNTDHYVFSYEVLADYVEKMEAYHNFKTVM